jgi:hypothetical protein
LTFPAHAPTPAGHQLPYNVKVSAPPPLKLPNLHRQAQIPVGMHRTSSLLDHCADLHED